MDCGNSNYGGYADTGRRTELEIVFKEFDGDLQASEEKNKTNNKFLGFWHL